MKLWLFRILFAVSAVTTLGLGALGYYRLNPDPEANAALGLSAWIEAIVFAIALCVLVSCFATQWRERWLTLGAMWRPLAILVLAVYLLFINEQGRELGVSLMIGGDGVWLRFVLLFFALAYWALNNWHNARRGISSALENGVIGVLPADPTPNRPNRRVTSHDTPWVFWPPRLLGVCAHLFAALSLGFAARKQAEFDAASRGVEWRGYDWSWVAWAPFALVALLIVLMLTFDYSVLSERTQNRTARSTRLGVAAGIIALFLLLCVFVLALPGAGFFWGTLAIGGSAVVYLTLISYFNRGQPKGANVSAQVREEDDRKEARNLRIWTWSLFGFAVVADYLIWRDAVWAGQAAGSMVIAFFAFGALLATLNVIEDVTAGVARAMKRLFGLPGRPHVVRSYATAAVVVLCVVNAWLHPFHRVRPCGPEDCNAVPDVAYAKDPSARPTVEEAAAAWYAQAKAAYRVSHGGALPDGDKLPMLVVATTGGGIRAAYWTAVVLEEVEKSMAATGGARPYLFSVSGVSGGSVGATAFVAAMAARDENPCKPGEKCLSAKQYLSQDFLAPALANWIFVDTFKSALPNWGTDRGTALERGFENASEGMLARPFLSLFPYAPKGATGPRQPPWRPILLLNGTHEETGKRIIAGHVKIERQVFIDAFDELDVLNSDVRASTAAHNSARFSYVSPAGDFGFKKGSVIDGGYFENFGALTALEIGRSAESALKDQREKGLNAALAQSSAAAEAYAKENPAVKLVFLMITSDPGLQAARELARIDDAADKGPCLVNTTEPTPENKGGPNYLIVDPTAVTNAYFNEFLAPLQGLYAARSAQGNRAAAELALTVCAAYPRAPEPPPALGATTPTSPAVVEETVAKSPGVATAATSERGKSAPSATPAQARPNQPFFAHLAMCSHKDDRAVTVKPPLGWVLSETTRGGLDDLVHLCGNGEQLEQLAIALGAAKKPPS